MKHYRYAGVALAAAALCACTQAGVDIEAERAALRAAADAYHASAEGMDMDGFAGSYTQDTLVIPPGEAVISGRDGARNMFAAVAEGPMVSIRFSNMIVDVAASGDMGYTLADGVASMRGADGSMAEEPMRDFHLWRKEDGAWKISLDIWNLAPTAEATSDAPVDPLTDALSAAWPGLAARVRVVDWEGNTLREGTTGYTCMPTPPILAGTAPMCMDEEWMEWADAWANKKPYAADSLGISYMLAGDEGASNIDPYAEGPTEDNEWIREGAHLMIVAPMELLEDYPTDPDNGGPYVMWDGSPYAHLMVPIGSREQ